MNLPMKKCELRDYVSKQLSYIFPDNTKMVGNDIDVAFEEAILRLEFCFKNISEILRQYFINHPQSIDKYTFLQNSAFTHWVKEKCSKMC